ncbi:MAG TPA: hypothetical protein VJT67_16605 [Longimicrobiaceae bacterium]|nr:hypothetical protein [Longimicrobiaceae bacterium]
MNRTLVAAAMLATMLPAAGAAQRREPLPQLAQELFLAETVYPQERGEVQLTLDARFDHGARTRLLGEYGITDRLQLSLVTPGLGGEANEEADAWEAGVLYAVLPDARPFSLSATVEASFEREQAPSWEPALIVARGWGALQLHATAAAEVERGDASPWGALAALLGAGRFTSTLELVRSAEPETFVVPGMFVHPGHQAEVAVGVPVCLTCDRRTEGVRAMFTVEF